MMRLLFDENMPLASYRYLLSKGYDIEVITGDLASISDPKVLDLAISSQRTIVTFDSDFGELIFKEGYRPAAVIYFRWQHYRPAEPGEYLHELLLSNDIIFEGFMTVFDRGFMRQRKIQ